MCIENKSINSSRNGSSSNPMTVKQYFMQGHEPTESDANREMTKLSPEEESKFQSWIKSTPWHSEFKQKYGEDPDLNIKEYDYRAAWKSGVTPQKHIDGTYHWGSADPKTGKMLKSANHPTSWMEYAAQQGYDVDKLGLKETDPVSVLDALKNK